MLYIHLKRNNNDTASSFVNRFSEGIIKAYRDSIIMHLSDENYPISVCLDYCDTINSNIELFLKDKTQKMDFRIENAKHDFQLFWELIGAEGDIDSALAEFDTHYNASIQLTNNKTRMLPLIIRILQKLKRLAVNLPNYIKNA